MSRNHLPSDPSTSLPGMGADMLLTLCSGLDNGLGSLPACSQFLASPSWVCWASHCTSLCSALLTCKRGGNSTFLGQTTSNSPCFVLRTVPSPE